MALLLPPFPQNDASWVGSAVRASTQDFMRQTALSLSMAQKMGEQISSAGQEVAKSIFDRKKLALENEALQHKRQVDYLRLALDERRAGIAAQNDTVRAAASMIRATRPSEPRSSTGKPGAFDGFAFPDRSSGTPSLPLPAPEPGTASSMPAPTDSMGGPNPLLPPITPQERAEGVIPPGEKYESPIDPIETKPAQTTPASVIQPTPQEGEILPTQSVPSVGMEEASASTPTPDQTLEALKAELGPELYNKLYLFAKGRAGGTADAQKEYFDEAARQGAGAEPYFRAMFDALTQQKEAKEVYEKTSAERNEAVAERQKANADLRKKAKASSALGKVIVDSKFPIGQSGRDEAMAALRDFEKTGQPFIPELNSVLDDIEARFKPVRPGTPPSLTDLQSILNGLEDKKSELSSPSQKDTNAAEIEAIDLQIQQAKEALELTQRRLLERATRQSAPAVAPTTPAAPAAAPTTPTTPTSPRPTPSARKTWSKYLPDG